MTRAPERAARLVLALVVVVATSRDVRAQGTRPAAGPASGGLPEALEGVAFSPPLGAELPDVALVDDTGATVRLSRLVGSRPALVVPVYYECPMLCSLVLDGPERSLRALDFRPGDEFDVLVFSIDPEETPARAAEARDTFLRRYGRPDVGRGVRFLTGDADAVASLADGIGFHYERDDETGEYAHAAGVVVVTADGRLARFLSGVDYPARDLRLAILEASRGEVGGVVDRALLYCFRYDPSTGRYSATVLGLVRAAGVATVAGLVGFVLWSLRSERRRRRREA